MEPVSTSHLIEGVVFPDHSETESWNDSDPGDWEIDHILECLELSDRSQKKASEKWDPESKCAAKTIRKHVIELLKQPIDKLKTENKLSDDNFQYPQLHSAIGMWSQHDCLRSIDKSASVFEKEAKDWVSAAGKGAKFQIHHSLLA